MNAPMRARRRSEVRTISLAASKHLLQSGPLKGRMVGSLTTEVLEDQKLVLQKLARSVPMSGSTALLESDLKAIDAERTRRWHAFTT